MFIRNETFSSFTRGYPVITVILALNIFLHIWGMFLPFGNGLRNWGIGFNLAVSNGEYWRLVSPIFLHNGLGHLLFNSFALVIFAPALEKMLGRVKFATVYLLAGVLANVATFYLEGPIYYHLGASGAIFGLFGIYVYMLLNRKDLLDAQSSQLVMMIVVISLIMTFVNPGINIIAHVFGLASGAVLAPLFLRNARPFYAMRSSSRRTYIDDDEVSFNPNRWKNQGRNKKIQKLILIVLGVLFVIGFIARIMM
ncbi:rhomboid family intramembrane serine protease [Shouchella shacheensis]|uniref:rhomboid family intramembrane serine protease n=1 Tax=Shouchella shacheensis TaxID=1649580 RepID=UPI0007403B68|nr:rhomboid family intramembrane serine protease [Shouchella shacheensis]